MATMKFDDQISGLPRAGSGKEIFIHSTVNVAPKIDNDNYRLRNQSGPEASLVTPGDYNVSDNIDVGVIGDIFDQEITLEKFPITIKVVDQTSYSYLKGVFDSKERKKLFKYVRKVTDVDSSHINRRGLISIPRFVVKYAEDSVHRITNTEYKRFPFSDSEIPAPIDTLISNGTHINKSAGSLVYNSVTDELVYMYLFKKPDEDTLNRIYLLAFKTKNNQVAEGSASGHWGLLGASGLIWNHIDSPLEVALFEQYFTGEITDTFAKEIQFNFDANYPPQVAGVVHEDVLYAIVSDPKGNQSQDRQPGLYVMRFNPEDPAADAFRAVTGPILPAGSGASVILKNIAAASSRGNCVVMAEAAVQGINSASVIQYSFSQDMKSWGGNNANNARLIGLTDFRLTTDSDSPNFLDYALGTDGNGWAVTLQGEIFRTKDSGRSWNLQIKMPDIISSIVIAAENAGVHTLYAVGARAMIFKSTDSGDTWRLISVSDKRDPALLKYDQFYDGIVDHYPNIEGQQSFLPTAHQYRLMFKDASVGWIFGRDILAFTTNGGLNWTNISTKLFAPQTVIEDAKWIRTVGADEKILLCGSIYPKDANHDWPLKGCQFVYIREATNQNIELGIPHVYFTRCTDIATNETVQPLKAMDLVNDTTVFAVGDGGMIVRWVREVDDSAATVTIVNSQTTDDLTAIYVEDKSKFANTEDPNYGMSPVLVAGYYGILRRLENILLGIGTTTKPNWSTWILSAEEQNSIYPARKILSGDTSDSTVLMIGGGSGAYYGRFNFAERRNPTLVVDPITGNFIMACTNVTNKIIEVWKSPNLGRTFTQTDFQGDKTLTFLDTVTDYPYPALKVTEAGEVILQAFNSAGSLNSLVSVDGGETWTKSDEIHAPFLPIEPLSTLVRNPDFTVNDASQKYDGATDSHTHKINTLRTATYGNQLWLTWQSDETTHKYGVWRAREWQSATSTHSIDNALPIIPGVPQWIGVDDLRIIFSGLPVVGDSWTIDLDYRYKAKNVMIDSPSIEYRSKDLTNVDIFWQRFDAAGLSVSGSWIVDAFALFKTNFARAIVSFVIPSFPSDTIANPHSGSVSTNYWLDFEVNSIQEYGLTTDTGWSKGMLVDHAKQWIPHQFRPAHREYYVQIEPETGPCYKILDNTETALILAHNGSIAVDKPYIIYGDRMFCDGSGGYIRSNSTVILPDIAGLEYSYPKLIRLHIPAQPSPDSYFRVGKVLFGKKTPLYFNRGPEQSGSHVRFSRGFGWKPSAFSSEDIGLSGVASNEQYGRTGQTWALTYEYVPWFNRDYVLNPLMENPQRAFALVFDHSNNRIIELVKLDSVPDIVNAGGDFYSYTLNLREVV